MSTLLLTLTIAFVIMLIAISFLAIGWLITGKSKIRPGACGRDPNKNSDSEDCGPSTGTNCFLCKRPDEKEKK